MQKMEHAIRQLAMVADMEPRDGLEAGLIVQMLVIQDQALEEMRRATVSRQESGRVDGRMALRSSGFSSSGSSLHVMS